VKLHRLKPVVSLDAWQLGVVWKVKLHRLRPVVVVLT